MTSLDNSLIHQLIANPSNFEEQGKAYQLLDEFFSGLPVDILKPLLQHPDPALRRVATWIVSELGEQACCILEAVAPLTESQDRHIAYYSLETVANCATGKDAHYFVRIARALESADKIIQFLAMRLLLWADASQLETSALSIREVEFIAEHREGLSLLADLDSADPNKILQMLKKQNHISAKYGSIAAKRLYLKYPELLVEAAGTHDPEIKKFLDDNTLEKI